MEAVPIILPRAQLSVPLCSWGTGLKWKTGPDLTGRSRASVRSLLSASVHPVSSRGRRGRSYGRRHQTLLSTHVCNAHPICLSSCNRCGLRFFCMIIEELIVTFGFKSPLRPPSSEQVSGIPYRNTTTTHLGRVKLQQSGVVGRLPGIYWLSVILFVILCPYVASVDKSWALSMRRSVYIYPKQSAIHLNYTFSQCDMFIYCMYCMYCTHDFPASDDLCMLLKCNFEESYNDTMEN
ncbi:E3 ubiquitin-protein ligase RNF123 [Triplophysa tibetana]|uniref:E3 ubiquitin-protein ligase RNF123 n=1 Tax=Triplophysa tibetana TaxID=1572043 RepID=A0A5A9NQK3_9TELE|nr:E3 ubiquitin-protein ligase RNF123 [Triplophysa tibetana]